MVQKKNSLPFPSPNLPCVFLRLTFVFLIFIMNNNPENTRFAIFQGLRVAPSLHAF